MKYNYNEKESPIWVRAWGVIAFVVLSILLMHSLVLEAETLTYFPFACISVLSYFTFVSISKQYHPKNGECDIRSGSIWDFIFKTTAALAAVVFISAGIGFGIHCVNKNSEPISAVEESKRSD